MYADLPSRRYRDLCDRGQVAAPSAEQERHTAASSFGQGLPPPRRLRRNVQNRPTAGRLAEQGAAIVHRILLRGRRELVHEALDHEVVVSDSDASPKPGVQDRLLVADVLDAERRDVV